MEDRRVPSLKTIVKSLRPTKTLIVVSVRTKLRPLPIRIAAENDGSRIIAAIDARLRKSLTGKLALIENVQPFDPEWGMMIHNTSMR
jgi:hypothetical protein